MPTFREKVAQMIGNQYAYTTMERSIGFAMLWHNLGGDEGLRARGMGRSTLYNRKAEFRRLYGFDVADFEPTSAYNDSKRGARHVGR